MNDIFLISQPKVPHHQSGVLKRGYTVEITLHYPRRLLDKTSAFRDR